MPRSSYSKQLPRRATPAAARSLLRLLSLVLRAAARGSSASAPPPRCARPFALPAVGGVLVLVLRRAAGLGLVLHELQRLVLVDGLDVAHLTDYDDRAIAMGAGDGCGLRRRALPRPAEGAAVRATQMALRTGGQMALAHLVAHHDTVALVGSVDELRPKGRRDELCATVARAARAG